MLIMDHPINLFISAMLDLGLYGNRLNGKRYWGDLFERGTQHHILISGNSAYISTLLRIFNSSKSKNTQNIARYVPLSCVAFSSEMASMLETSVDTHRQEQVSYNFIMALADQRGHIYALDFIKNRFWTIARTGVVANAICFNTVRRRELLVGLADNSLHCYNIGIRRAKCEFNYFKR